MDALNLSSRIPWVAIPLTKGFSHYGLSLPTALRRWTLWRYNVHSSSIAIVILNDLAESWTPISRATIWCNVRYTTRPNKTWAGPLISEASQVLIYLKIESFKSLPRIPVSLMSEILTGLRYCCINRLTLTWCFRWITRKEVCNPLSRFLNFL